MRVKAKIGEIEEYLSQLTEILPENLKDYLMISRQKQPAKDTLKG